MRYQQLATASTPFVELDYERKWLLLEGISIPEDPKAFYSAILNQVLEQKNLLLSGIFQVELRLFYINTSSLRELFELLRVLKDNGFSLQLVAYVEEGEDNPLEYFVEVCRNVIGIPAHIEFTA